MSFLKKMGAVVVGTTTAAVWLGAEAVKAGFEAASDKLGQNGSVTDSNGRTYTGSTFKNSAEKVDDFANNKKGFVAEGFKMAKKLWTDD